MKNRYFFENVSLAAVAGVFVLMVILLTMKECGNKWNEKTDNGKDNSRSPIHRTK